MNKTIMTTSKEIVLSVLGLAAAAVLALSFAPAAQAGYWDYGYYDYNYNIQYVVDNQVVALPDPPAPPAYNGGVGQICWGTCWDATDEEAGEFVEYYLSLVVMEFGSVEGGSYVVRDEAGRVTYIACYNGGTVTVTYANPPAPPYSQAAYYSQATYYAEANYYAQANYAPAQASYYSQGYYQAAYYAEGAYAPSSPGAYITAEPVLVSPGGAGGSSNLLWSAANVTTCSITTPAGSIFSGAPGAATTTTAVTGVTKQTRYTLSCTGAGGTVTSSVLVNVVPTFDEF